MLRWVNSSFFKAIQIPFEASLLTFFFFKLSCVEVRFYLGKFCVYFSRSRGGGHDGGHGGRHGGAGVLPWWSRCTGYTGSTRPSSHPPPRTGPHHWPHAS